MSTATNAIFIPEVWVQSALIELEAQTVFLDTVPTYAAAVPGELGDVITIPKLNRLQAGVRSEDAPMYFQETSSTGRKLSISDNAYIAFYLTSDEVQRASRNADLRTLFMRQAMVDLVEAIEAKMAQVYAKAGVQFGSPATAFTPDLFLEVGQYMTDKRIPKNDRTLIMGSKGEREFIKMLSQDGVGIGFSRVHPGAARAAEAAEMSNVYGFRPFVTPNIVKTTTGGVTTNHNVMFQPGAVMFGSVPLLVPEAGLGVDGASISNGRLSIRLLRSFEHDRTRYKFSMEVAFGFDVIEPEKIIEVRN